MNEDSSKEETQTSAWDEEHPWLTVPEDDDPLDEVIRYTLNELRLA